MSRASASYHHICFPCGGGKMGYAPPRGPRATVATRELVVCYYRGFSLLSPPLLPLDNKVLNSVSVLLTTTYTCGDDEA